MVDGNESTKKTKKKITEFKILFIKVLLVYKETNISKFWMELYVKIYEKKQVQKFLHSIEADKTNRSNKHIIFILYYLNGKKYEKSHLKLTLILL